MKFKKTVSAAAALAMSVSAFAGIGITARAYEDGVLLTENFDGDENIFNASVIEDGQVGKVLNGGSTKTATFAAPYKVDEGKQINVNFTAYQCWGNRGSFTVSLKNSKNDNIASYTYNLNPMDISPVIIGEETQPALQDTGRYQSLGVNNQGANNFYNNRTNDRYYVTTAGNNTAVTISVDSYGLVTMRFYLQKNGSNTTVDNTVRAVLPADTTLDISSIEVSGSDLCGIDNLEISQSTSTTVPVNYTINYRLDSTSDPVYTANGTSVDGVVVTADRVVNTDSGNRYYTVADSLPTLTLDSDGTNVLNVIVRAAYVYTVSASSNTGISFAEGSVIEGDSFTYSYPQYLTDTTGKVTHVVADSTFTKTETPTQDYPYTVNYEAYTGTAYFAETSIGNTAVDDADFSDGSATRGLAPDSSVEVITVPESGVYKITTRGATTSVGNNDSFTLYKNSTDETNRLYTQDLNYASVNYVSTESTPDIELNKGDKILVVVSRTQVIFDSILLEKTDDLETTSISANATSVSSFIDADNNESQVWEASIEGSAGTTLSKLQATATYTTDSDPSTTLTNSSNELDITNITGEAGVYAAVVLENTQDVNISGVTVTLK